MLWLNEREKHVAANDLQKKSGVVGRYIKALLDLTEEAKVTQKVVEDFTRFRALLDESADLRYLVKSPVFSAKEQVAALNAVLQEAGISGLAAQFISFVAAKHRLNRLPEMLAFFEHEAVISRGFVFADAVFAAAPSKEVVSKISALIKDVTQKDVSLETSIDPELIGGVVIKIGSRMVDGSIRSKLNSLRQKMKATQ